MAESANATHEVINATLHALLAATTKLVAPTPPKPILPVQTGVQAQQEEQSSGMTIFFSLLVIAICIILVHLLIEYRLHFLPESVAVVSLGILMGAFIKIIEAQKLANWKEEEMFRPNMFFLLLLPPIIFESGYSLHKGNFFQNIGSIILFSVFGTAISAFIVGGGIYFLGRADVIYKLNMTDSFAFGSLISAVDPVATIAIFNALNVDPVLNMLVFGESILNDAVSIVLTNLHLGLEPIEKRQLIGTTTIIIVLFTILLLGGGTMPLIRLVDIEDSKPRKRNKKDVNLSKTEKMGNTIESEHLSELTEEEYEAQYIKRQNLKGFMRLDVEYLNPFFTRRLTQEDLHDGRIQMKTLTNKWYEEVRQGPSGSEDDEQELLQQSGAGAR
ncbi:hypothetical protein DUI87_28039 [Hirundo rustica rustica]|uniref:Sodium/hydrogen exchanger 8 n=1 Tax=Hirundo rustica rustica TaxID=333673 RepID=A0A3M0J504_HIRRU|nr:hypothetical protein DUI87_28039 [Hirundo rustica rustica]